MNKVALLLGSGMSIPAGLPGTWDITNEILNNYNKWFKDGEEYRLKTASGQSEDYFANCPYSRYPQKISRFLKIIATELNQYYCTIAKSEYTVNYEEIFDVINQIKLGFSRDVDNPLTNRIIHCLVHSIDPIFPDNQDKYEEVKLLCKEAEKFIKSVIHLSLVKKHGCINYLDIISQIVENSYVPGIATLNHDTLLEKSLRKNLIEYNDGFAEAGKGVRFFDNHQLNRQDKLKLLKLHGSIDWYNFRTDDGVSLNIEEIGQYDEWQSEDEVQISVNDKEYRVDKKPLFLTGFNNKYLEYNYGIYLDLFYQFHQLLNQTDILIIAGYGFGDNTVNLRIIDWYTKRNDRKIEIITPNKDTAINNAKGAIHSRLKFDWSDDRIHWIEKGIQELEITDLKYISKKS